MKLGDIKHKEKQGLQEKERREDGIGGGLFHHFLVFRDESTDFSIERALAFDSLLLSVYQAGALAISAGTNSSVSAKFPVSWPNCGTRS